MRLRRWSAIISPHGRNSAPYRALGGIRKRTAEQTPKYAVGPAIKGKRAAIFGVGGRAATAGMRENLARLLAVMGVTVVGETGLGISLAPEAWRSGVLELEPGTQGALEAMVGDYIAAWAE